MRRHLALALVALLLASSLLAVRSQDDDVEVEDEEEVEEEKAFLITRKSILETDIVVGKNATVLIEVYNAGTSSALDVDVEDEPWPAAQFDFAGGSSSALFPRITAGSSASFQYFITPLMGGYFTPYPAKVTYRDASDSTDVQTSTSSVPHLAILTTTQKYLKSALFVGRYASFGSLTTPTDWRNVALVLGAIGAASGIYWSYSTVTAARKRSKYQRALEEVTKMK